MKKTSLEFIIKALQDLHQRTVTQYDWCLEQNKKVMSTETQNHYLQWKVDYLEKRIKEHFKKHGPVAGDHPGLYDKDNAEFERLKQEGIQQNADKYQEPDEEEV